METVEIAFIICHLVHVTPALGGSPLSSRLSYHPDFISYSIHADYPGSAWNEFGFRPAFIGLGLKAQRSFLLIRRSPGRPGEVGFLPESVKYLNLAEFIPRMDEFRSHSQMVEDGGFGPDGLTGAAPRLLG